MDIVSLRCLYYIARYKIFAQSTFLHLNMSLFCVTRCLEYNNAMNPLRATIKATSEHRELILMWMSNHTLNLALQPRESLDPLQAYTFCGLLSPLGTIIISCKDLS